MGCNEVKFDENEYSGGGGNMRKDIATLALADFCGSWSFVYRCNDFRPRLCSCWQDCKDITRRIS